MRITKVVPPTNGGTQWSREAVSTRQHYLWFNRPEGRCSAMSGKLRDGLTISRSGKVYSRFYAQLRHVPPALAREVAAVLRAPKS